MAWGIFNKIKKGLKKAGKFIKDKIVKPVVDVAKKAAPVVAPALNTILPGSGTVFNGVVNNADKVMNGNYEDLVNALRSGKIRLK